MCYCKKSEKILTNTTWIVIYQWSSYATKFYWTPFRTCTTLSSAWKSSLNWSASVGGQWNHCQMLIESNLLLDFFLLVTFFGHMWARGKRKSQEYVAILSREGVNIEVSQWLSLSFPVIEVAFLWCQPALLLSEDDNPLSCRGTLPCSLLWMKSFHAARASSSCWGITCCSLLLSEGCNLEFAQC